MNTSALIPPVQGTLGEQGSFNAPGGVRYMCVVSNDHADAGQQGWRQKRAEGDLGSTRQKARQAHKDMMWTWVSCIPGGGQSYTPPVLVHSQTGTGSWVALQALGHDQRQVPRKGMNVRLPLAHICYQRPGRESNKHTTVSKSVPV